MKSQLLTIAFLCLTTTLSAANYYWVGGTGEWDDVGHWATTSGGSTFYGVVPSAADDVFIDANSFTGPDQGINLRDINVQCRSFTITTTRNGAYLESEGGAFSDGLLEIYGSVAISGSIRMDYDKTIIFRGGAANTIDFGDRPLSCSLVFEGAPGGAWTVTEQIETNRGFSIRTGDVTFATGVTIRCADFEVQETATVDLSGLRYLSTRGVELQLRAANATQLDNCAILVTGSSSPNFEVTGLDALTIQSLTYFNDDPTDNDAIEISEDPFGDVSFTELIADSLIFNGHTEIEVDLRTGYLFLRPGTTHDWTEMSRLRVTGRFISEGNCDGRITLIGGATTTVFAPAAASIEVSTTIIENVRATGAADFTATASISSGTTTGWNFVGTVGNNRYWVGGNGNWTDENHWAYTSGGAPGACPPSEFDNAIFDANSFSANGQQVNMPEGTHTARTMDWRDINRDATLYAERDADLELYGSLYLDPRMTWNGEATRADLVFAGTGAGKEILSEGRTDILSVNFNGNGSEWTLLDDLRIGNQLRMRRGQLDTDGMIVQAAEFDLLNSSFVLLGSGSDFIIPADGGDLWRLKPNGTGYYDLSGARFINRNTSMAVEFAMENNAGRPNEIALIRSLGPLITSSFAQTELLDANLVDLRQGAFLDMNGAIGELILAGGYSYNFENSATDIIDIGTLTSNSDCLNQTTIQANNAITFTSANAQTVEWVQLRNIAALGPDWTAVSSIDLGGNTGWDFSDTPASRTLYWIGGAGDWPDPGHWSLTSGGPGGECPPSQIDDVLFDAASFDLPDEVVRFSALDDDPPVFCRTIETRDLDELMTFTGSGLDVYGSAYFSAAVTFDLDNSDGTGLTFRGNGNEEFFSRATDLPYVNLDKLGVVELTDSIDGRRSVVAINDGTLRSNGHLMRWALVQINQPSLGAAPVAEFDMGASETHIYSSASGITMRDEDGVLLTNNNAHVFDHAGARYRLKSDVQGLLLTFLPGGNDGEVEHATFSSPMGRPSFRKIESFKEVEFSGPIRIDSLVLNKGSISRINDRYGNTLIGDRLIAIGSGCSPIDITGPRTNVTGTIRFSTGSVAEMDYVRLDHVDAIGPGDRNAGRNSTNVDNSSNGWDFVTNPSVQTLDRDFLGPDLNECGTIPAVIRPNTPPDFVATYRWQDGTTTPEFSPPGPGTYRLAITFGEDNCTLTDEIMISNGDLSLGPDEEINACGQDRVTLTVPDASATGYSWRVVMGSIVGAATSTEITVEVPAVVELEQTVAGCSGLRATPSPAARWHRSIRLSSFARGRNLPLLKTSTCLRMGNSSPKPTWPATAVIPCAI